MTKITTNENANDGLAMAPATSRVADIGQSPPGGWFPVQSPPIEPVVLGALPEQPLVSIIVPSFNQGRFIRATIDSILSQDYRPLRIHVLDGGSTDETVNVLKSFGSAPELDWVSEPDRGVVDAVNKGFAKVRGHIVGIQSSDDTYRQGAIARVVGEFCRRADLGMVYGDTVKIDAEGHEISKNRIGPWSLENMLLFRTWIPQPSCFIRRELLQACGGWDERIPYAPDTDLWMRIAFRTNVSKIDEYLSERRIHDAQRDTQAAKISRDYCKMIDQSRELAVSNDSVRRKAKASQHLIHIRYNAKNSDWHAAWQLWQAGRWEPSCRDLSTIGRYLLLPTRRILSKAKQRLMRTMSTEVQPANR